MNSFVHHLASVSGVPDDESFDEEDGENRPTLFGVGPGSDPPPPSEPLSSEGKPVEAEGEFSRQLFSLLEAYAKKRRGLIATKPEKQITEIDNGLRQDLEDIAGDTADLVYTSGKTFSELRDNEHVKQFQKARVFGDTDFLQMVKVELDDLDAKFLSPLHGLLDEYALERKRLLQEQESADIQRFAAIENMLDSDFRTLVRDVAQFAHKHNKSIGYLRDDEHIQQLQKSGVFEEVNFLDRVNSELEAFQSQKKSEKAPEDVAATVQQRITIVRVGKTPSDPPQRSPMQSVTREKGGDNDVA